MIFPTPPFCASTCASAASRNVSRRPIGRTNLPSRRSSANSRTFDGSGFANTRVIFTVGRKSIRALRAGLAPLHLRKCRSARWMVKGRSRNRAYSARRDLAQDGAFDVCGLKRPVLHDVWSFSRILHTLQIPSKRSWGHGATASAHSVGVRTPGSKLGACSIGLNRGSWTTTTRRLSAKADTLRGQPGGLCCLFTRNLQAFVPDGPLGRWPSYGQSFRVDRRDEDAVAVQVKANLFLTAQAGHANDIGRGFIHRTAARARSCRPAAERTTLQ